MSFTPDRRPIFFAGLFGAVYWDNVWGIDPTFRTSPNTRIAEWRAIMRHVSKRFCIAQPQGKIEESNWYGIPASDVLAPTIVTWLQTFRPPSDEDWILYTGASMPLDKGDPVEDLFSQDTGTGPGVQFTAANLNFVTQCVRFWQAAGFKQLWLDAMTSATENATMDALQAHFAGLGIWPRTIGGEALPLIAPVLFQNMTTPNLVDMPLVKRRPYLFLEANYARNFDPLNTWTFDPYETEVHVIIDHRFADWGETAGIARLNDFVRRGMIVSNGGGPVPTWAQAWWFNQYQERARVSVRVHGLRGRVGALGGA